MATYGGKNYTNFRGVSLKDGNLRFGGTATAHMNPSYNSGDKAVYSKDLVSTTVPYFWNGTTAFSMAAGFNNVRAVITGTTTLIPDDAGLIVLDASTGSINITFPSAVHAGLTFQFANRRTAGIAFNAITGQGIETNTLLGRLTGDGNMDAAGDTIQFTADGGGTWYITSRYIH